jgi:hypothetical protein
MRKLVQERTMFKILIERAGALFSFTTRSRAYFFFLSTQLVGVRVAPTTDPYPGIVEVCNYDIASIVRHWEPLANVKLRRKIKPQHNAATMLTLLEKAPEGEKSAKGLARKSQRENTAQSRPGE